MNLKPVTTSTYQGRYFLKPRNYSFSEKDTCSLLTAAEIPLAMLSLPTAFMKFGSSFSLVLVQGLQEEKNLLLNGQGYWRARYLPDIYKAYPFRIGRVKKGDEEHQIVCFDEDSKLLLDNENGQVDEDAVPFFDEQGNPSELLGKVNALLNDFAGKIQVTNSLCTKVRSLDLLKPWDISFELDKEPIKVQGLYMVDEEKLNSLNATALKEMRDCRALALCYGQLYSTGHIKSMINVCKREVLSDNKDKDLNFGELLHSDALNFDGF